MMKMKLKLLCAMLALALLLTACGGSGAPAAPAGTPEPTAPAEPEKTEAPEAPPEPVQEEIEDWRAEQKIVVNGETYPMLLRALCFEEGDPLDVRLESDVQLTNFAMVLGTSDYGGMFNGMEMTVPSRNIVIDLNGYTLTAEKGYAVFEVQAGYTLTIVDNSGTGAGKLEADGEPVIVADGGTYIPLEG